MQPDNATHRVYHIGPWRIAWLWIALGPVVLFFWGAAPFTAKPEEKVGMLFGGGMFLLVLLIVTYVARFARLELSESGVRLKQTGYRLETPWANIIGIRLNRGHEGLITSQPVGGKGAGLLAAAGNFPLGPASLYDTDQQTLLSEYRLIPIEAFAWHLRHGKLRQDLERFAPHLVSSLAALDHPPVAQTPRTRPPSPPPKLWQKATLFLIFLTLGAMLYLGTRSRHAAALTQEIASAFLPLGLAVYLGFGSREFFRRGSWIFGSGMLLVGILQALWAFAIFSKFAGHLGYGRQASAAFGTAFFGGFTLLVVRGAQKSFHRHWWPLGILGALAATFLALCTVQTAFDLIRVRP